MRIQKENLIGNKYGRWTVLDWIGVIKGKYIWKCKCECGTEKNIDGGCLRNGTSKSCGCYRTDVVLTKHGVSKTRFYHIWQGMKQRCLQESYEAYPKYGGRGIKLCDRWKDIKKFKKDMYKSYLSHCKEYGEKQTSIDRIDNDGNYDPSNCRWATCKEQSNNTRYNVKNQVMEDLDGSSKTKKEIANKYNIKLKRLNYLLRHGFSLKGIIKTKGEHLKQYSYQKFLLENIDVLNNLTPRQQNIIKMRYGIGFDRPHTLEEVGQEFGVTRERIRQIEAKSLQKIEMFLEQKDQDEVNEITGYKKA